jgi:RHS repeat-associated protein
VVHYVAPDHLGSTSVSHNTNTGSTGTLTFFPFGAERSRTGFVDTERTFTGQVSDGDTGLMFYNARYYDPVAGRFTQADTILADGPNRYTYVLNNPLARVDPTGRCSANPVERERCAADAKIQAAQPKASSATASIDQRSGFGQVSVNLFIMDDQVCWIICVEGDGRGFSDGAGIEQSRASIQVDFDKGTATVEFNYSCRTAAPSPLGVGCASSSPVSIATARSVHQYGAEVMYPATTTTKNSVSIVEGENSVFFYINGTVSVGLPGSPAIDGRLELYFNPDGSITAQQSGNGFPSYEVYQYNNGETNARLLQEERSHGDLIDGATGALFRFFLTCEGPLC